MRSQLAAITRSDNLQTRRFFVATCIAATVAIGIGVFMLAAWHSHSVWLANAFPNIFYMKYNTSLAFIAGGTGLFAGLFANRPIMLAGAGIVSAIGALTLVQYLSGVNLGIDELFLTDYLHPNNPLRGRMAPSAALALSCLGVILFLSVVKAKRFPLLITALEALCFVVLAVGATAVAGYLTEASVAYSWSTSARIAPDAAVGFIALGIGSVALIWQHQSIQIARMPLWLPAMLCFSVLLFDLSTPLGLAAGIAYVPIIFCSLWFTRPSTVFVFAGITTALTVLGYFASPPGNFGFWVVIANRTLTIGALWIVALLVFISRRNESAFRQSTNRLQAVVDHALDGVIAINEQGIVEHFNPACERIFGYDAREVIGHNIKMLMPEPYHGEHDGYLSRYLKTGEARIIGTSGREVTARRKDGSEFPMDLSISAFHLEDGRHFSGIIRDITERKKSERQIVEEAARTQAVMNTVLDGVITIDGRGTVQTINPAAVQIFGYAADEVVGRNVNMLMPEPYHGGHDGYLDSYLTTGAAKVIGIGREVSGKRKDGSVFPMELGVNEMRVGNKRTFVGTVRDISERKQSERQIVEEAARTQAVMNTVLDGVITIDERGTVHTFNPSAVRIFGYQPEEVIGRNIRMLMPAPYHDEHDGYLENYRSSGNAKVIGIGREVSGKRKDGSVFPMELGVNAMEVEGQRTFVGTVRDISDRRNAEIKLGRYTTDLERSNQELDDFAYIASHDLKEPLRGLFNHSSFLLEDYKSKLDDEGLRRLNRLGQLCQRMEQLINDLMYFSRLGRAELAVKETDINAVILDIQKTMDVFLDERHAQIDIPLSLPSIVCDPVRITEVFRNLITNAVKYCDNSTPLVEIGFLESAGAGDEAARNVFYVRDNGVGIDPAFHQEIFRIFKRLQPSGGKEAGTGVGLTFVKKIVEREGGRIWLESELGTGTTFYFTLNGQQSHIGTQDPAKEAHELVAITAHSAG